MRYVELAGQREVTGDPRPAFAGGRRVSAVGLGTWQFGSREWGYGTRYDQGEAARIVRRALELGVTLFDTAEVYGAGRSERILGEALRSAGADPEALVVASKILPVVPAAPVVERRARASAERLGVRRIDLYQVHQPHPLVGDGSLMRGMRRLRAAGVIDQVGVSNYRVERWCAAESALGSPVVSNQVQYSLVHPGPDGDLVPYALREGRLVIAWSPLAQGLLSGAYGEDHRPTGGIRALNPVFRPEALRRAAPLVGVLREIAAGRDATPAQIALAWVLRHPCVAAIPGASSVAQLERNVAAADIVLRDDEVAALSAQAARYRPLGVPAALRSLAAEGRAGVRRRGASRRPAPGTGEGSR